MRIINAISSLSCTQKLANAYCHAHETCGNEAPPLSPAGGAGRPESAKGSVSLTHHFSSSQFGGRHENRSNASRLHGPTSFGASSSFALAALFPGPWKGLLKMTVDVPLEVMFRLTELWKGFFFGLGFAAGTSDMLGT